MRQPTRPSEAPGRHRLSEKQFEKFKRFKAKAQARSEAAAKAGRAAAEAGRDRETNGRNVDGGSPAGPKVRPPTPPRRRAVTLRPAPEIIEYRADEPVVEAGQSRSRSPEAGAGKGRKGKKGKQGGKGGGKKGGK